MGAYASALPSRSARIRAERPTSPMGTAAGTGATRQTQEAAAVAEGLGMRGNFMGVRLCVGSGMGRLQMRHVEIVRKTGCAATQVRIFCRAGAYVRFRFPGRTRSSPPGGLHSASRVRIGLRPSLPPPFRRRQVARKVALLGLFRLSQRRKRERSVSLRSQSRRSSIVGVSRSPARTKRAISAAVEAAATAQMRLMPSPNKLFRS